MKVITAPEQYVREGFFKEFLIHTMFLAGSIEQGKARNWQDEVVAHFEGVPDLTLFNPRRKNWDSTWVQSPDNSELIKQIDWELEHIDAADCVFFFLQAGTQSPISLMELGLVLGGGTDAVVVCEKGFWREANVVRTCERYDVEVFSTLEDGLKEMDRMLF